MSFESWMQAQSEYTPLSPSAAFAAGRAEAEAEMRSPGPCGIQGHMNADWVRNVSSIQGDRDYCQLCAKDAEITALKADLTKAIRSAADYGIDRNRLREALQGKCLEWRSHAHQGRYHCEECRMLMIENATELQALLSAPASGQPAGIPEHPLRVALRELLQGCIRADLHGELSEYVDGSLLDNAKRALGPEFILESASGQERKST